MTSQKYKNQVSLLLDVLPTVAKEQCFALHGGTAINLFVRDLPRLSVDIDLTYVPIEDRETTLRNISEALNRIKTGLEELGTNIRVQHKKDIGKLLIRNENAEIKVEVNLVGRGVLSAPVKMTLCERAQDEFDAFAAIPVVPIQQLYGGKICAALDRQHPRDLYDVRHLLDNEGITKGIKEAVLYGLLCSDRPTHEVLFPNLQDQRQAMENQFVGMSAEAFEYADFEETRRELICKLHDAISEEDIALLLSFTDASPDWSVYDFSAFPAVRWKLQNLEKLKRQNLEKHQDQYQQLFDRLNAIR